MDRELDLFRSYPMSSPLADRMRPHSLDEVVGQDHLVGSDGVIRAFLERRELPSMIFWGPPGCGKTTMARLLADASGAEMVTFSAVLSGVKEARSVMAHLWIPVIVIGTSGTASMIRRLRANLLDELEQQYVLTGKAKGLPPGKLLRK